MIERTMKIEYVECKVCHGKGSYNFNDFYRKCPKCHGSGIIKIDTRSDPPEYLINKKFRIPEALNKTIQNALFDMGFQWLGSGKKIYIYDNHDFYIYIDNTKTIFIGGYSEDYEEIDIAEFFGWYSDGTIREENILSGEVIFNLPKEKQRFDLIEQNEMEPINQDTKINIRFQKIELDSDRWKYIELTKQENTL